MIVDTSAILAILRDEPDANRFAEALAGASEVKISAATFAEAAIVTDVNRDPILSRRFDELVSIHAIEVEPVTWIQAETVRKAYRDFGKGSGHPAQLNFGDCFAYALALETGMPLLYKGDDFAATGVAPAITTASSP